MPTKIAEVFLHIPWKKWEKILEDEPEWCSMRAIYQKYPFGAFATSMLAVGLNDFQLKGKADEVYWPGIQDVLGNSEPQQSPDHLLALLTPFFQAERIPKLKCDRLARFLTSELAISLWNSNANDITNRFEAIGMKLSITMGQTPQAKTIAFAMKCLAISLLMAGEYGFDFSHIPIPVDSRIRLLMQKLAPGELKRNGEVQCFWSEILRELKAEIPKLSMIHLDSLCWQIGTLSESELRTYFKRLGLPEVAEKLINMIQANNYLHINKRTK